MKIPSATYRLQFNAGFTFEAAGQLADYLRGLGVSHVYASPILKAVKGSMHGYDVVDPAEINPELGGSDKFTGLVEKLKGAGLAWLQDIVPNHMAYNSENLYLRDVLEYGSRSRYRTYFDIDWDHPHETLRNRVLAPFLGDLYGTCIDDAEIQLRLGRAGFYFQYGDNALPLRIDDYPWLLRLEMGQLEGKLGAGDSDYLALRELADGFERNAALNNPVEYGAAVLPLKASLYGRFETSEKVRGYIEQVLKRLNGVKGQPASFNELDSLLARQNFRFCFWKVSNEEMNYRRFFTINGLISTKIELEDVFDFIHDLPIRLVKEGKIDGLRVDHLDGLYSPLEYLKRLKTALPDTYVVAEKILDPFETLPQEMELQGTTGYDALNYINGVFVEKTNERKFTGMYGRLTGLRLSYDALAAEKKRFFMASFMGGEIDNLSQMLRKILGASRYGRDLTGFGLRLAIVEMFSQFAVYRSYVTKGTLLERDEIYIGDAYDRARNARPDLANELELIRRTLLLCYGPETPEAEKLEWVRFTHRFQQLSGALMAKGTEDTSFYIYNRLISLNEVGGDPALFGILLDDFHDFNGRRLKQWPHALTATATHDTKRGEDARARINVISELPEEWEAAVKKFMKINRPFKKSLKGVMSPDENDEYLIYQALAGAYPFADEEKPGLRERIQAYAIKAIREAKVHTGWIKPDTEYETACTDFVNALLDPARSPEFWAAFLPLQKKIAFYGIFNSLSQLLLKLACPGVPDIYQGCELWDFNLVDPDNRRPVDYKRRMSCLDGIRTKEKDTPSLIRELLATKDDGRIKLFALYRLLRARNERIDLFRTGGYIPLELKGGFRNNVVAFARKNENDCALILAPRFLTGVIKPEELPLGNGIWKDTAALLPDGFPSRWENVLTGGVMEKEKSIYIGDALDIFPVALLTQKK